MPSSSRRRWPPLSTCRVQRAARCPPASTTARDCRSGPVRSTSRSARSSSAWSPTTTSCDGIEDGGSPGRSARRHGSPRAPAPACRSRRRGRRRCGCGRRRRRPGPSGRPVAVTRMSVAQEAVPLCRAIAAATSLATFGSPSIATTPPADSRSTSTSRAVVVDAQADQGGVRRVLVGRAARSARSGRAPTWRRRRRCATRRPGPGWPVRAGG